MNFDKLFEPIQIGAMELKNRIAMAPMQPGALPGRPSTYAVERLFIKKKEVI